MSRQLRIVQPNTPHHIVQRGHSRQVVFAGDDDYDYYRDNLVHLKQECDCRIYAYCLMTNHVHLIVDPGAKPESLSKLMKGVAGRQTRYVNKLENLLGVFGRAVSNPALSQQRIIFLPVAAILSSTLFVPV